MSRKSVLLVFYILVLFWGSYSQAQGFKPGEAAAGVLPAQVAGSFYPASPVELSGVIENTLKESVSQKLDGEVKAIIVPHAGYSFSAIVGAAGYKSLARQFSKIFIIASNHNPYAPSFKFAAPTEDFFETPLGKVKVSAVAHSLLKEALFSRVPEAFASHIIEVQLPFLQKTQTNFEIVPIVTSAASDEELAQVAELIVPYLDKDTLVVISSDLSHYHPYEIAQGLDQSCIKSIENLDSTKVAQCEACGLHAIKILLHIAAKEGWKAKILDYKNSGDTSGDKSRVVGYSAIAFFSPSLPPAKAVDTTPSSELTQIDKRSLLRISRSVLEAYVKDGKLPGTDLKAPSVGAGKAHGCFVTLRESGVLRGCIGTILPGEPLYQCVIDNTVNAASHDSRFPPVKAGELDKIEIEISVLSVPSALIYKDSDELLRLLQPKKHGLIIGQGWHQATFLPQVWDELPDKVQFLEHLCRKGGMPSECWKSPDTKAQVYEDIAFREKE